MNLIVALAILAATGPHTAMPRELNLEGNYSVRGAAEFAYQALERGTDNDLRLAEGALEAVLSCQERREGAARRGNFLWQSQDEAVGDLNSVEFTLSFLIPLLIDYGDLLPGDLRDRVRESVRLGLEEIRRLDVALTYTNIASLDCCNSCLGGELLGDTEFAERGYRRFKEFCVLIARNGTVFEFNSPTYMQVTARALGTLEKYVRDPTTKVFARLMGIRLGLSAALHVHPALGPLAGPYSRAYFPSLNDEWTPHVDVIRNWIDEGILPDWIETAMKGKTLPMEIRETASADWKIGATTYLGRSFALGVASREVSRQTNCITIHVDHPEHTGTGVICSRYLLDDSLLDATPAEDLGPIGLPFFDDGKFFGVQSGPRALGVYAPRGVETRDSFAPCGAGIFESAKAAIVWLNRAAVDEIWVGAEKVETLPQSIGMDQVVVVKTGPVYVAVRPLVRTEMGHGSPIQLVARRDKLVLEMHNYLGPPKTFWDLDRGSRFYQGQPVCAFYLEVAEAGDYPSGMEFAGEIIRGVVRNDLAEPFTSYHDGAERPLTLAYSREGAELGLEVDLMDWRLKRRWNQDGDLGWPMLESPNAVQSAEGRIELGSATLTCGKQPALLYGNPCANLWVACYYGEPAPLVLTVPEGRVEVDSMGPGMIVWNQGGVEIEALQISGGPTITGGELLKISVPTK